ncbi:hypothetical protein EWB00_009306 [Schistosoma japonicum]|uniref:Uncharacterized protein n=1 Tax=Schistosoma japonicum TaxID=6182 RepID=A0A4Z2DS00_SCHJA|nr:hypothetical protein EWB00_009306 [Schistosoma japonicum]
MNKDNFIGNDVCVNKFDDIRDDKINVDEAGCGENEENIDNEGENDEVRDNDGDDGNEYGDVAIDIDEDVAINTYSDFIDNSADAGTVVVDTVAVAAGDANVASQTVDNSTRSSEALTSTLINWRSLGVSASNSENEELCFRVLTGECSNSLAYLP